jgi:hypothetical protein
MFHRRRAPGDDSPKNERIPDSLSHGSVVFETRKAKQGAAYDPAVHQGL